jgi:hypothetical protein
MEVVGPTVELHHPDLDLPIVAPRPHLGQLEWIEAKGLGLRVGHHLDEECPAREVAALDRQGEIASVTFAIMGDDGRCLLA